MSALAGARPARPRVMIVDDDGIVLEVTRDWLQTEGYDVIQRQEALGTSAAVMRERPDVILLDINMPALGGEQLALLISRLDAASGSIVVLHSSCPENELLRLVRQSGAAGGIRKTSDRKRFLAAFQGFAQRQRTTLP